MTLQKLTSNCSYLDRTKVFQGMLSVMQRTLVTATKSGRLQLQPVRGLKVLCVLYPDPTSGYPPKYARTEIPSIKKYANGQTAPNPQAIDFKPGELLGCVSGGLGLRPFLSKHGAQFLVTDDKEGPNSVFEKELHDADVVISQPFWPAYMTGLTIQYRKETETHYYRRYWQRSYGLS